MTADENLTAIPPELQSQLATVAPSRDQYIEYRPCLVELKDGRMQDRVYVVEASAYIKVWGVWPWDDNAKQWVSIRSVARFTESPSRLPPKFADRLYEAGESGMGYVVFKVVLEDGRSLPFAMGNAVDFPNWPPGVRPEMVADIFPHAGREEFAGRAPTEFETGANYAWCLYLIEDSSEINTVPAPRPVVRRRV